MRRRCLPVALLGALMLASPPVLAQPQLPESGRAWFDAGTAAFESGQYRAALKAYHQAYELDPLPETAFSMGQAARLAFIAEREPALLDEALKWYAKYVEEVPAGRRRAHAVQHMAALEAMRALAPKPVPDPAPKVHGETFLLVVSRTPGAQASVDGAAPVDVPVALSVAPGEYEVLVLAPGHQPASAKWIAVKDRLVVAAVDLSPLPGKLVIEAQEGAQISVDGRAVAPARSGRTELAVPDGAHRVVLSKFGHEAATQSFALVPGEERTLQFGPLPFSEQRVSSLALFGAGSALLLGAGAAAVVALAAEQRALDFEARIGAEALDAGALQDHTDDVAQRDHAAAAAWSLLGVSTGATLAAVVVFATDGGGADEPIAPAAGPGDAGLSVRWHF